MILKRMAVLCCGFLMLSLTHATSEEPAFCNISLIIPKHIPELEATERNGNINNRSLSAWNWNHHINAPGIPGVIYEAKCQSHHCLYPDSYRQGKLNSVPIYSTTLVLTRHPKDRTCFTAKFQTVAMGCTCVRARSSP